MEIAGSGVSHRTLKGAASHLTVIPAQAGIQGWGVDSRFRGSDCEEALPFSSSYVARRGMGNYHENSQRQVPPPHPEGCGIPHHRHSRESGNPGSRDVGRSLRVTHPHPWIPAYAGMTVGRLPSFSSPYLALARAMGNSRESGNPGSRDVGRSLRVTHPHPWIPAYAGMTVGRLPSFSSPYLALARAMGNSRESGNPGSRDVGRSLRVTHPPSLNSGLRRNDGREAAVIFIPLLGLGKGNGQFPRKRESRVPRRRAVIASHPPPPLDSGLRRNDGREAAVIFIPLLGLGKGNGQFPRKRESRVPQCRSRCKATHPHPWIPAYAGMTVGAHVFTHCGLNTFAVLCHTTHSPLPGFAPAPPTYPLAAGRLSGSPFPPSHGSCPASSAAPPGWLRAWAR